MMRDEITVEGVAALLTQLAAVQMERDEFRARAEAAEAEVARLTVRVAELEAVFARCRELESAAQVRVAELEAELNREIKHRRLLAGAAQYYGCPYCGNPIDLPAPPQE